MDFLDFINFIFIAFLGAIFGSFGSCLIYRAENSISIFWDKNRGVRSFCDFCGVKLKARHLVPIFSFLFLRGKCGFCGSEISRFYLFCEIFCAILAIVCFLVFGFSISAILGFLAIFLFLINAVIDYKNYYCFSSLSLLCFVFCLLFGIFINENSFLIESIINTSFLGFSFVGFAFILRMLGEIIFKKEALGEGDILFFGSLSCALGDFFSAICAISFAAILASIFGFFKILIESKIDSAPLDSIKNLDSIESKINSIPLDSMPLDSIQLDSMPLDSIKNQNSIESKINLAQKELKIPFLPFLFIGFLVLFLLKFALLISF